MPLVSMKEMLADATKRKYAIGCYNCLNLEMAKGIIKAAEEEKSPVIICHAEVHFKFSSLEEIGPIMMNAAIGSKVPVAVMLDHGKSFSAVIKAMHMGFNSIMFDASELEYEENVKRTGEMVKIAKELGVSIEAELGHVTRPKGGGSGGEEEEEDINAMNDESLYTNPQQAGDFVEKTGIDALAPAFGTAHGVYIKKPVLDLFRLSKIREYTKIPLVMHGGSGLTEEDFKSAISNGIAKINYYTGLSINTVDRLKEHLCASSERIAYHQVIQWSIDAVKDDVKKTMILFGSTNKA